MPKPVSRILLFTLTVTILIWFAALPAAAFDITTPTRTDGKGAPYLHMDPNTRACVNRADKGGTRRQRTEAELDSDARTAAEMNQYLRPFRFAYIGLGAQSSKVDQGGVSSTAASPAGTVGLDIDGLNNPLTLELSGKFAYGGNVSFGETFLMVFGESPISAAGGLPWSAPYRKRNMDAAYRSGKSYEQAARENWGEFTRFCEQFSPVRVGIGIGVGGFKLDQAGGPYGKTHISVAGIPVAARVGYFGPTDMVRLTGYYLDSSFGGKAPTGTEMEDGLFPPVFAGGPSDYDVDTEGKYVEARLDWYHRLDGRIADRKLLSGYGVSAIYREARVDAAVIHVGAAGTPITLPEVSSRQIELLFTVGYMR